MTESEKNNLFRLCASLSCAGHTEDCVSLVKELAASGTDSIETDALGNIILRKNSLRADAPTVLIDAHLDEIGFLVREILDGGFCRLVNVGGHDPAVLPASHVILWGDEPIFGVIASVPPHLKKKTDGEELLPDIKDLLVDTGYEKATLEKKITVGTPVTFLPDYGTVGDHLVGKSFDDKACAAAALTALTSVPKETMAVNAVLLLSNQEENHPLGAVYPAAFGISPDYALVCDVNLAEDVGAPSTETVPFGKISFTRSALVDKALTDWLMRECEDAGVPVCVSVSASHTGTNAPSLTLTGGGIPVVDVGLPLRSMHTPSERILPADFDSLCKVFTVFLTKEAKVWN